MIGAFDGGFKCQAVQSGIFFQFKHLDLNQSSIIFYQYQQKTAMLKYLAIYTAVFLTMFIIDMVWLGIVAKSTYANAMGALLRADPNLWAAAAFYLLFPVGLLMFAVLPQADSPVWKAALMGALFGFFAYSTYDLTNLAVIKDWPLGLTFIDMAWGTMVSGMSAAVGKLALDWLNK